MQLCFTELAKKHDLGVRLWDTGECIFASQPARPADAASAEPRGVHSEHVEKELGEINPSLH